MTHNVSWKRKSTTNIARGERCEPPRLDDPLVHMSTSFWFQSIPFFLFRCDMTTNVLHLCDRDGELIVQLDRDISLRTSQHDETTTSQLRQGGTRDPFLYFRKLVMISREVARPEDLLLHFACGCLRQLAIRNSQKCRQLVSG